MKYVITMTTGSHAPWTYQVNNGSIVSCRKEIISKLPKKNGARGAIYRVDGMRLDAYMKANGIRIMNDKWWKDYTTYYAKLACTVFWDPEFKSWSLGKTSLRDSTVVSLVNPDGTIKTARTSMTYLRLPQYNTTVGVSYTGNKEYLDVSTANGISFKFTRNGSKCIEIWDVHTGEEIIYHAKEVEDAIKHWYSKLYAEYILPSLKLFLSKEKKKV